jgi:hypothetical protein
MTFIGPYTYVTTDPVKVVRILNVTVSGAPVVLMKLNEVHGWVPHVILLLVVEPSLFTAALEITEQYEISLVGGSNVYIPVPASPTFVVTVVVTKLVPMETVIADAVQPTSK